MSDYSFLRTGFNNLADSSDDEDVADLQRKVGSLMMVFARDAMQTASEYAIGCGRRTVKVSDVHKALKYQARMFFQNNDSNLEERVEKSYKELLEYEGEEDESEEEEGEEGEDEDEEGEDDEELSPVDDETLEKSKRTVRHVDHVCSVWHLYNPSDPLMLGIKKAVDATGEKFPDECGTG